MALRLLLVAALVALSQAQLTYKAVQCKSTGFGTWDPICTIKGIAGETYGLCTDKTVGGISGSYFSVESNVATLCYTYMFETTEASGFGTATYLYRGANLDSSVSNCQDLCKFLNQVQNDGKEIKNLYVGCTTAENGNNEDLTTWWRSGSNFTCSKADGTDYNSNKLNASPNAEGATVTVFAPVKAPEFLNYLVVAGVAIVGVSLFAFLPGVTMCYFWKKSIA